jgi:hypothetical protein
MDGRSFDHPAKCSSAAEGGQLDAERGERVAPPRKPLGGPLGR